MVYFIFLLLIFGIQLSAMENKTLIIGLNLIQTQKFRELQTYEKEEKEFLEGENLVGIEGLLKLKEEVVIHEQKAIPLKPLDLVLVHSIRCMICSEPSSKKKRLFNIPGQQKEGTIIDHMLEKHITENNNYSYCSFCNLTLTPQLAQEHAKKHYTTMLDGDHTYIEPCTLQSRHSTKKYYSSQV